MIKKFVDKFNNGKQQLRGRFISQHPGDYDVVVQNVIEFLSDDEYNSIDPKRITRIDHGDYQGTLVYMIGSTGYQPYKYWCVKVSYGSCSGCDTLQYIECDLSSNEDGSPSETQIDDYMMLCLHVIQNLKEI